MQLLKRKDAHSVCPKRIKRRGRRERRENEGKMDSRFRGNDKGSGNDNIEKNSAVKNLVRKTKYRWLMWIFPIAGLASLIWFLIRVLPKPSRATYPCQRVAFPLASGFVVWVLGLVGSGAALKKAKLNFARRRYILGLICVAVSVGAIWLAFAATSEKLLLAEPQPVNQPIGEAKGVHPGRVVWVHDPDATDWDGPGDGHPWESNHTSQIRVSEMMSEAIQELTGKASDAVAWDKLFRHFNQTRGKGDVGYKPGEKIVIKVNFVGFIWLHGGVKAENYNLESKRDYMNTSPQMIIALLRQLVNTVGVKEADIAIGDSLAYFANEYYNIFHKEFPNVRCIDHTGKLGRIKAEQSSVPLYWSSNPKGNKQDYAPVCFAKADYLINFANLKAHTGAGVTLCAKNHYGSLIRWPAQKSYYDMHTSAFAQKVGVYRALVDLMGHAHIGGKTVLYLIDGLYCGIHPTDMDRGPRRWKSYPFNGDWTSSLLASQDPVAIDSVGFDFLYAEYEDPSRRSGVDDYLQEAALANNPPSGTFYDPDHSGNVERLASLGVHEHWNNPKDKQYSRNLGTGKGIELVAITPASAAEKPGIVARGAKVKKLASVFKFTEGPAVDARGNVFFTDQPNNRIWKWSVDGKLSIFHKNPGRANGLYFDKQGDLLACADLNNELWSIDMKGKVTVLVKGYKGKKLNGPNDLWIDLKGGIYFTDPFYRRRYWNRGPMEQDGQHVYYLYPDRKKLIRVTDDLVTPNGIIGTPDGKLLYVADIGARKTYVYNINKDGTLSNKKLFCSMGSDGMTLDNEGNVYLTGKGVTVFNSAGEKIEHIDIDAGWTANVCFGGEDRQALFITAQTSLYALRMRVKGVALESYSKHDDAQQLIAYLQHKNPDQQQVQEAQGIVDKAQVISLHYEKDEPLKSDSDRKKRQVLKRALREKGIFATGINHHSQGEIYPQLSATFSRLFSSNLYNQPEPEYWLEYMKLPINMGYVPKSVRIIYSPTMETKKITLDKCNTSATKIANELEHLQPRFKQLKEFDKNKLSIGKWGNGEWPSYPRIFCRFGFGAEIPNTKGSYEKTTENWCLIRVWFESVTGNPRALVHPVRIYPRQGITTCWLVRSADDSFNKKISQLIVRELRPLNEYEKELEVKK